MSVCERRVLCILGGEEWDSRARKLTVSVVLNLKNKEAMKIMYKLIEDADVFVENYVPGKLEKFGLGWEQLKKINPRLIYCSVTGEWLVCHRACVQRSEGDGRTLDDASHRHG